MKRWESGGARRRATRSASQAGSDPPRLAESALAFAVRCHDGQRRESDGALFIEHPLEVARLLRDTRCSEELVAAGLLHDVVEDADVAVEELAERFGAHVAELVSAVSDDACMDSYRPRKRELREQVRRSGREAALLFAADKISRVRELAVEVARDRANDAGRRGLERHQQLRLEHYDESLRMLRRVAPRHPLVRRLGRELDACRSTIDGAGDRRARASGREAVVRQRA
ncbi:MAG: hypothetical protein QOJ35_1600 [Solirubrobacteraceae bacterium]|jgi:(p)ppGpp synthase/HD superfamily hydrolase|nr:hypothetical protein [Solirubrobacteraceae bacterium]